MKKATLLAAILCAGVLVAAPTARAVDVDLQPAEQTAGPGETVSLTISVTNDTDEGDMVLVFLSLTVEVEGKTITLGKGRPIRLKLDAGESVEKTIEATLPEDLPVLPIGDVTLTITADAKGVKSGTEDTATATIVLDVGE